VVVQREGKRFRLFTRNGHDWTNRYPLIVGTGQYRIFVEPAASKTSSSYVLNRLQQCGLKAVYCRLSKI
jgi:hypothetical protein